MKIRRFSSSTCRYNGFLLRRQRRDLRAQKGNYVSYVGLRFFFCKYRILYQLPEQPILGDDFTNHRLVRFLLGFVKLSRDNFVVMLPVKRVNPYLKRMVSKKKQRAEYEGTPVVSQKQNERRNMRT